MVDSNVEADLIHLRFFKDIIVKKLKPISTIETLFEKLQKPLRCYNILFNAIDNLQTTKHQILNFIMIDIDDLDMILKIL